MDINDAKLIEESLSDIYDKIPCSVCEADCFRCCTNMVQFTEEELNLMGGYKFDGKCSHLVTEWKEFRMPSWNVLKKAMRGYVVVDGRNIYDGKELKENGFNYYKIG